ncbi:hypothetical protein ACNTMW_00500 [Planosporangium sp. 12N6]|uniref:hypothetical protein n=1 Tax=Planosporangium spinosum TaxID=3402278 RepID=UPI003CEF6DD0
MTGQPRPTASALTGEEENFFRAMHYCAGTALVLGVACEALAAVRQVIERALRERDGEEAGPPKSGR